VPRHLPAVAARLLVGAACSLAALTTVAAQQPSPLRAAAQLTGLTSGMAQACRLDPKPVLHAFRDLMDRKRVQGKERQALVRAVSTASDRGMANQAQPGAMSCADVRQQMARTIRRLQRAR
jgi:hypothetical protein